MKNTHEYRDREHNENSGHSEKKGRKYIRGSVREAAREHESSTRVSRSGMSERPSDTKQRTERLRQRQDSLSLDSKDITKPPGAPNLIRILCPGQFSDGTGCFQAFARAGLWKRCRLDPDT